MSQDREFEKYLEGKSGLSKLYADLPEVDVPKHLDAAILAEAHRAVNSRPGGKPKRRWVIPLSMAASLIVAVMVGLQLPYMLKDAAQPQPVGEEKMAGILDKSIQEIATPAPVDARKEHMSDELLEKPKAEVLRSKSAQQGAEATAPMLQAAPAAKFAPQAAGKSVKELESALDIAPPPVVSSPPAKAVGKFEMTDRSEFISGLSHSKEKKVTRLAEVGASSMAEQQYPSALRKDILQPAEQERSLLQSLNTEEGDTGQQPGNWLKRIKKLKDDGKIEEAKKELLAFKKRYPDYRVPKNLKLDK